jgi:hypothetical protein
MEMCVSGGAGVHGAAVIDGGDVIVATPLAFAAGLYVSVPLGVTAGWSVKSEGVGRDVEAHGLRRLARGPGEMAVAQPAID